MDIYGYLWMQPGTLSVQYRNPSERKISFHQISYISTKTGGATMRYNLAENLHMVGLEIDVYLSFNAILAELLDLTIQASLFRWALVAHTAFSKENQRPRITSNFSCAGLTG